ncbi:MAG: hypothetical protein KAS32_00185 [Candidatus Peribacteraceae bacterium]|nr:hypothetical protein [Candidatus Peribacteraceae bacterium]
MTEKTIKDAIKRHLGGEGWVLWFVHKKASRIKGRVIWLNCDIFTIFDTIAMRGNETKLIQYTSVGNMGARVKKIEKYYQEHNLSVPCEVWGYEGRSKWTVTYLYENKKNRYV